MSSELVQIFRDTLQKLFDRDPFKFLPRLVSPWASKSRGNYSSMVSPSASCAYMHTRWTWACARVSLRIRRQRWRDTHRPRYCCLPITSDNGSISGSGAEIVPPSVTGMAHAAVLADVFERNAISAITKVEAGNWRDPLSVICTRYNGFGGFSLLFSFFFFFFENLEDTTRLVSREHVVHCVEFV